MTGGPTSGLSPVDQRLLWVLVLGGVLVVDGLALLAFGSGSLLPSGTLSRWWPLTSLGSGVGLLGAGLSLRPGQLRERLRAGVPRLFPFASVGVQLSIYLAITVGAVAVFQGTFESFTNAHNGGDLASVPNPESADALVIGATGLLWLLAVYTVLVVRRVIQMGRRIDRTAGRDVYGREVGSEAGDAPEPSPPPGIAPGLAERRPVPRGLLFASTLVLAFGVSVATQTVEVGTLPAPASEWWWAQLALPVWAGVVASGISSVDRGIRDLEFRYSSAFGRASSDAPPPRTAG
jgi:hypothetical protein